MERTGSQYEKAAKLLLISLTAVLLLIILKRLTYPLYEKNLGKDVQVTVTAEGEKNELSQGTSVYLQEIQVNQDGPVSLGTLEYEGEWGYSEHENFLFAENIEEPKELKAVFQDVRGIVLRFAVSRECGIVKIAFNNSKPRTVDLYRDTDWESITVGYNTSFLVGMENDIRYVFLLWICIAAPLLAAGLLTGRKHSGEEGRVFRLVFCICRRILRHFVLAVFVFAMVSIIQYSSLEGLLSLCRNNPDAVWNAVLLLMLLLEVFWYLHLPDWLSFGLAGIVCCVMAVISVNKEILRNVPLLPWDISFVKEGMSVLGRYKVTFSIPMVFAFAWILFVLFFLLLFRKKTSFRISLVHRVIGLIAAVLLGGLLLKGNMLQEGADIYQISDYYQKNGLITAFVKYCNFYRMGPSVKGYDETKMEQTEKAVMDLAREDESYSSGTDEELTSRDASSGPNIIMIMSESFWDITRLQGITFHEDPLPVFHELQKESIYGNALSHVFGGGTVVSEFEALTGFSGEFFPKDYMVYGDILENGFYSAVQVLEEQGYETLAMHPYIPENYNREQAYEYFGFDRLLFEKDFAQDSPRLRQLISDEAVTDKLIEEYEAHEQNSDAPFFQFAVTMQNHGGYGYYLDDIDEETETDFTINYVYEYYTVNAMRDLFYGLEQSDKALGRLADYLREQDEETILIFFGDHMSDASLHTGGVLEQESWHEEDSLETEYQDHLIPFFIWSSKGSGQKDMGTIQISELLPTAMEMSGLTMTPFMKFLLLVRDSYGATSDPLLAERDGSVRPFDDMTEEQKSVYETYRLLEYDYIWGNRYAEDLFQIQ